MRLEEMEIRNPTCRASMLGVFDTCRRKWFYMYRLGLIPKRIRLFKALKRGQILHKLMQYGPQGKDKVNQMVVDEQKKLMKMIEAGEDLLGQLNGMVKNLTEMWYKCLAVAQMYWDKFPPNPDHEVLLVEKELETMWFGHKLQGRIDRLILDKPTVNLWLRDYKSSEKKSLDIITAGTEWGYPAKIYKILVQQWMLENNSPGRYAGIIIDGVRMPGIKYCPGTKDKDFDAYIKRVEKWIPELGGAGMQSFAYPVELLDDGSDAELLCKLNEIKGIYELPVCPFETIAKFHLRAGSPYTCQDLYGNEKCPYFELCSSAFARWPFLIENKFEIVEQKGDEDETNDA